MKKPYLIDTHAHVNFRKFKDDADKIIRKTLDKNVWLINIGSEYKTSKRAIEYAEKYDKGVYAAIGIHPVHLEEKIVRESIAGEEIEYKSRKEEFDFAKYLKLGQSKKVVAIGEIGLDYTDRTTSENKALQKENLLQQLELAQQLQKPVVFHCRKAYDDLIEILESFQTGCMSCPFACPGAGIGKIKGTFHCFMGRWSQAEKLLNMGFYFSFNGLITYARDYDKVIKNLPLKNILIETDCPYLTPVPHRGQRNEPLYVEYVAKKIAEIKGVSLEEVAKQTTANARELFNI